MTEVTERARELAHKLTTEAMAMRAAVNGHATPDSFHLANWQDKPHRVLYDACKLLEEAAQALTPSQASEDAAAWICDAYLEGYSQGMCAGTLVNREEDWLKSKARAAITALRSGETQT